MKTNGVPKLWFAELVGRGLNVIATVVAARALGVEAYGLVGYAAAVTLYGAAVVQFGSDFILVRELSRPGAEAERELRRSQLRFAGLVFRACTALPVVLTLLILHCTAANPLTARLFAASILSIAALIIPMESWFQSDVRFGAIAVQRILTSVINLSIIVWLVRAPTDAWIVPAAGGCALLLGEGLVGWKLLRTMVRPAGAELRRRILFFLIEGAPLFGGIFLALVIGQLGIVVLQSWSTTAELGCYVISYKVYDIGNAFIAPVATVIFPLLSALPGAATPDERTAIVLRGILISVPLAMILSSLALLAGSQAMPLIFGSAYGRSSVYLMILAPALVFRGTNMFLGNTLVAAGKQRYHFYSTLLVGIVTVAANVYLVPIAGAIAAAAIVTVAFALETVVFGIAARKLVRVLPVLRVAWRIAVNGGFCFVVSYSFVKLLPYWEDLPFQGAVVRSFLFVVAFLVVLHQRGLLDLAYVRRELFSVPSAMEGEGTIGLP